jgi:hypothetical protein
VNRQCLCEHTAFLSILLLSYVNLCASVIRTVLQRQLTYPFADLPLPVPPPPSHITIVTVASPQLCDSRSYVRVFMYIFLCIPHRIITFELVILSTRRRWCFRPLRSKLAMRMWKRPCAGRCVRSVTCCNHHSKSAARTLSFAALLGVGGGRCMDISICGDNNFYSHRNTLRQHFRPLTRASFTPNHACCCLRRLMSMLKYYATSHSSHLSIYGPPSHPRFAAATAAVFCRHSFG